MHELKIRLTLLQRSLIVLACSLLGACGGADELPVSYAEIPTEFVGNPPDAVDPTALPAVDDTRTTFYTFRTQSEWNAWAERVKGRHDPRPLPSVDLSGSTVAGVRLGKRTNSCYTLSVTEVVDRGGVIVVRYREGKPGSGDTCSPFVVYPLRIIQIRATGLPIEFQAV